MAATAALMFQAGHTKLARKKLPKALLNLTFIMPLCSLCWDGKAALKQTRHAIKKERMKKKNVTIIYFKTYFYTTREIHNTIL